MPSRNDSSSWPSFGNKLLVLRHSRLRRIPPAWNGAEYLVEKKFPVLVAEFGNLKEEKRRVNEAVPRVRIANVWAAVFPSVFRPLCIVAGTFFQLSFQFIKSSRPGFILAHGLQEELLALALHWVFGIPYAIHAHEIYDRKDLSVLNRFFLSFEGQAFRRAAFLIFPERNRERLYRSRHRFSARSFLVYNCPRKLVCLPSPKDLKAQFNLPPDAKILGYWGGVGELNAIEEGIRALCLLPHFYFVIWGWGEKEYLSKLKAIAEETGVSRRVIFAGQMPDDKWPSLCGLDVGYCVYDPNENLRARYQATASNKLMEAIAVGLPVVSSASSDFKKIVDGEAVGVCAKHLTAASIAGAIRELVEDEDTYKKRKQKALKLHQNYFHFEAQFDPALVGFAKYLKVHIKDGEIGLSASLPLEMPTPDSP